MLRLNQIRDLLTVIDCGSMRSAALRLGVSQPAMTKSIRMLEAELGAQLLQRSAAGVVPTPAGHAFAARARLAQHQLLQARAEVAAIKGSRGTLLSVGVGSAPAALFAVDAIARYRAAHPDGRLHIVEGPGTSLLPLVRDGSIDVALVQRVAPQAAPGLKYRALLRTRLVVVCRQGHALRSADSLAELQDAQWLVYRPPGSGGVLEAAFSSEGLPFPLRVVHCESFAMTVALIAGSDMIGLLVPQLLSHPFAQSSLQQIVLNRPMPAMSVGMYRRGDTPISTAANAFWVMLTDAVQRVLPRTRE